jgi:DtxR family Mn-dependent transcriptional regulator
MASSTVENYLKQLYLAEVAAAGQRVPMGRVAQALRVVPGTATSMVKALADSGLVDYEPRGGVRLSEHGRQLALHVLRRHRLIELFLVQVVGLDWSEVHVEAEELEHAVSDKVLDRIDALLGHPSVDPHGDPIPSRELDLAATSLSSLADCESGQPVVVVRVADQEPTFLQFIERSGLKPGARLVVTQRDPAAGAVVTQLEAGPTVTLGTAIAAKVLVEAA